MSRRWLGAICLAALLPQGAMGQTQPSRAEATAFCLGVVWSAGQVFAMRPPHFMTRLDADLVIAMPDTQARALALAAGRDRREGTLDAAAQDALRQAGGATLLGLLAEGGFADPDYRALRDACRGLGRALHGTDQAALEAAYDAALEIVGRFRE